jgi:hypothetical protein
MTRVSSCKRYWKLKRGAGGQTQGVVVVGRLTRLQILERFSSFRGH